MAECTIKEAQNLREELGDVIRNLCSEYTEKTGVLVSVEASPSLTLGGATASYRCSVDIEGFLR